MDIYQLALRQQQVYQQQNQQQHKQLVEGGLGGGSEGGLEAVQLSADDASGLEPKAMAMEDFAFPDDETFEFMMDEVAGERDFNNAQQHQEPPSCQQQQQQYHMQQDH